MAVFHLFIPVRGKNNDLLSLYIMRGWGSILLLISSNVFMTWAWYGHLRGKTDSFSWKVMPGIILLSWGIAFFEYCLQVPANRLGYQAFGGPFNLWQLKVIQEVISLSVFTLFTFVFFKEESIRINHLLSFFFLTLAVYFAFKS